MMLTFLVFCGTFVLVLSRRSVFHANFHVGIVVIKEKKKEMVAVNKWAKCKHVGILKQGLGFLYARGPDN